MTMKKTSILAVLIIAAIALPSTVLAMGSWSGSSYYYSRGSYSRVVIKETIVVKHSIVVKTYGRRVSKTYGRRATVFDHGYRPLPLPIVHPVYNRHVGRRVVHRQEGRRYVNDGRIHGRSVIVVPSGNMGFHRR